MCYKILAVVLPMWLCAHISVSPTLSIPGLLGVGKLGARFSYDLLAKHALPLYRLFRYYLTIGQALICFDQL